MNIFVLDEDPIVAARYQCDKHVVKMMLETAQLLSTAQRELDPDSPLIEHVYKPTHKNHPCAVWVRESSANYGWTIEHLQGLLFEYRQRYKKTSKIEREILPVLLEMRNPSPKKPLTPFAQAMPDEYKRQDAVEAYRLYYRAEKAAFARWERSVQPDWWIEG